MPNKNKKVYILAMFYIKDMATTERILVTLDKDLLKKLDERLKEIGAGASRSGFISDAVRDKLEVKHEN